MDELYYKQAAAIDRVLTIIDEFHWFLFGVDRSWESHEYFRSDGRFPQEVLSSIDRLLTTIDPCAVLTVRGGIHVNVLADR